jgi:soluble lytic murein transglycosylase-like protein
MKSKLIIISVIAIIFSASLYPHHAPAKVYKRVNADGSIDFYNKNDGERRPPVSAGRNLASKFDGLIEKISAKHGVDPHLVRCIIKVESDFNPDAVSSSGAMGLMQLMQETVNYYFIRNPFDPETNIETGVRHFKSLLTYFKNDVLLSLAAYHAGIGRVKKRMSLPPIQATVDYVNAVMSLYTGSKKNYAGTAVNKLYKRIERDGTIVLYSK